jgi:hypothetical protein
MSVVEEQLTERFNRNWAHRTLCSSCTVYAVGVVRVSHCRLGYVAQRRKYFFVCNVADRGKLFVAGKMLAMHGRAYSNHCTSR